MPIWLALVPPLPWPRPARLPGLAQDKFIVMSSTTSTEQSGLFAHLLPAFKKASGIDIRVVALHPGWVRTDMGGSGAPLSPEQAVVHMRKVITSLKPADSGRYINYDGSEILW